MESDDGGSDTAQLVSLGIASRERDLDGRVVDGFAGLNVLGQCGDIGSL